MKFVFSFYNFWKINSSTLIKKKQLLLNIPNFSNVLNFSLHSFYLKTLVTIKKDIGKTRSEVRGGGRKPRPQKGTGNARLGSLNSPLLRGGGVNFTSNSLKKKYKINKKERKVLISLILFNKQNKIKIFNDFLFLNFDKIKMLLKKLNKRSQKFLIIYSDKNYYLRTKYSYLQNFSNTKFKNIKDISFKSLFLYDEIYFLNSAFNNISLKFLKLYDNIKY